jgi:hypothetical protein
MNAKKSTGPTSVAGKKITSQNALKTGVYSKSLILPGEDASEFQQLVEQFMQDFQPADIVEFEIVRDLAGLAWKKIRLENIELKYTLDFLNRPWSSKDGFNFTLLENENTKTYLKNTATFTPQYLSQLKEAILFTEDLSRKFAEDQLTLQDLNSVESKCPLLYKVLMDAIELYELTDSERGNLLKFQFEGEHGRKTCFLEQVCDEAIDRFNTEIWCFDNKEEIDQQLQALHNKRLMELMKNHDMSRAFDDLRRNFFRTLGELRKHQKWRKESRVIDVTPTDAKDQ